MNYDLFIPPQFQEVVTAAPASATTRDSSVATTVKTKARVSAPSREERTDQFVGLTAPEEVSSDEQNTKKVKEAVELVNRLFDRSPVDLNLSIDNDTKSLVIKLIERETHKVIRQIPPDEILRLRRHLQEMLGVVFDTTA